MAAWSQARVTSVTVTSVWRVGRVAGACFACVALARTVACKVLPRDSTLATTVHDIDIGEVVPPAGVALTGLVVTGVALADGVDPASLKCRYRAFAQDPAGEAPSGIVLYAYGPQCQGAACACPSLPSSGSLLDPVDTIGGIYDVEGSVSIFHEGADGGAPVSHSVYLTSITKTGSNGFITPVAVSDAVMFGKQGAGYTANESMLVKLSTGAAFPVSKPDLLGSFSAASGAWVSGDYREAWWQDGGFPTAFTQLDAITGVASPLAGGGITPRTPDDFVLPATN